MSEKNWAETRCERRVGNPSDRDTCHRKATVFRNGRQWCKWHDPAKPTRLERAQAERAVSDDMEAIHHGAVSLQRAGQVERAERGGAGPNPVAHVRVPRERASRLPSGSAPGRIGMSERIVYIAEYKCGCIAESRVKRELLEYCAKHGDDRRRIHRVATKGAAK
jgi:hypothetical protein